MNYKVALLLMMCSMLDVCIATETASDASKRLKCIMGIAARELIKKLDNDKDVGKKTFQPLRNSSEIIERNIADLPCMGRGISDEYFQRGHRIRESLFCTGTESCCDKSCPYVHRKNKAKHSD